MKQNLLLTLGIISTLALTGCQSARSDRETEALQEQIAQLQQQIQDLEQQVSSNEQHTFDTPSAAPEAMDSSANETTPASNPETEAAAPSDNSSSSLSTTHTIEELTAMVSDYETKINAAVSTGSAAEDMEQFLTLKQEEKQIDSHLDRHEDELEYLYRQNALSRDEYKTLDRELERLEDRLDDAEDRLEYTFGIND